LSIQLRIFRQGQARNGSLKHILLHFATGEKDALERWAAMMRAVVIAGRRNWPHAGWGTGTSREDRVRFGESVAKVSSLNRIMLLVVG
jgi:hypothetical protein